MFTRPKVRKQIPEQVFSIFKNSGMDLNKKLAQLREKAEKVHKNEKRTFDKEYLQDFEKLVEEINIQNIKLETQNKNLQTALEQQQKINKINKRYESVFAASNAGITVIDSHGKFIECNQAFANMLGYTTDELYNKTIESITYGNDFGGNFSDDSRITQQKSQTRFEKRYLHKNGQIIWCDVTTSAIQENKTEYNYVSVVKDITQQKATEKRLRENEQRLELFFQESHEGFFFMMLDEPVYWNENTNKEEVLEHVFTHQRITKINKCMLDQYRAKKEDFIGLTPADLFAHDIEHGKTVWRQFFDHGKLQIDTEERKFDGTPMIVTGQYICLYDEKGRITGHFGVQQDVTKERNAKRDLKLSEEKFRSLMENSPLAILLTDQNGTITDCNKALETLISRHREEIIRSTISHFHEEFLGLKNKDKNIKPIFDKIRELYNNEVKFPLTYTTTADIQGTEKHLDQTIFKIHTASGFIIASITKDITEQKNAEKTILTQNRELEKNSIEKNKFFNIIAHDLRSPFNALIGFSNILLKNYDRYNDAKKTDHIEKIHSTAKNAYQLTENLLTWARAQSNKITMKPEPTDMFYIVQETILHTISQAENKNISIKNQIKKNTFVLVDNNSIQTVLRNLLTNAIKFSYRNGQIKIYEKTDNKNRIDLVEICIEDYGVGMSPETVDTLFKLDKTTSTAGTEKETGSGLGLIICKEFIEKNNGAITVSSIKEEKTQFCISLPSYTRHKTDNKDQAKKINNIKVDLHPQSVEYLKSNYKKVKKQMSSYNLQQFAKTLQALGHEQNIPRIKEIGDQLNENIKNLDLTQVEKIMSAFEEMLESKKL